MSYIQLLGGIMYPHTDRRVVVCIRIYTTEYGILPRALVCNHCWNLQGTVDDQLEEEVLRGN